MTISKWLSNEIHSRLGPSKLSCSTPAEIVALQQYLQGRRHEQPACRPVFVRPSRAGAPLAPTTTIVHLHRPTRVDLAGPARRPTPASRHHDEPFHSPASPSAVLCKRDPWPWLCPTVHPPMHSATLLAVRTAPHADRYDP